MSIMPKIKIGITGEFQNGKSLLVNCLLKRRIATVGRGDATTHSIVNYLYVEDVNSECVEYVYIDGETKKVSLIDTKVLLDTTFQIKIINVYLNVQLLYYYTLVDMPGMGDNDNDNNAAIEAMRHIDYAILLENNWHASGKKTLRYVEALKKCGVPYYFVLNCTNLFGNDSWHPYSINNENLAQNDRYFIERYYAPMIYPFVNSEVPVVNLMWYWFTICNDDDELLDRREIKNAKKQYDELNNPGITKKELEKISNFHLIEKIFSMENRMYLELKKEIKEEIQKLKDEVCPIGTIQAFAFKHIPDGWMICNGRWLQVLDYPELFGAIGHTFGKVDDDSFRIPDLRGRFVRGWGKDSGIDKNRKFGSFQEDSIQGHYHVLHMESNKTKKDGSHDHYIGYETLYFGTNTFSNDDPCKSLKGCSDPHELSYGDSSRAIHEHELPKIEVRDITKGVHGIPRVDTETRPANVALLYCIKTGIHSEARFFSNIDGDIVENPYADIDWDNDYDVDDSPISEELNYKDIINKL